VATYKELFELRADSPLRNRVSVATVVKAQDLIAAVTPTAAEITWANNTLTNAAGRAQTLLGYVLAANKSLSVAQIQGASDLDIQTEVDTAADAMIAGGIE